MTCTRVKCANRPSEASLVQPVRLKTVAFPANGDNVAGAANNESMRVVLMSARDLPPRDLPPEWRFLSKPFRIAVLLDCVNELGVPRFQAVALTLQPLRA